LSRILPPLLAPTFLGKPEAAGDRLWKLQDLGVDIRGRSGADLLTLASSTPATQDSYGANRLFESL
jgi:hypothetical protein